MCQNIGITNNADNAHVPGGESWIRRHLPSCLNSPNVVIITMVSHTNNAPVAPPGRDLLDPDPEEKGGRGLRPPIHTSHILDL